MVLILMSGEERIRGEGLYCDRGDGGVSGVCVASGTDRGSDRAAPSRGTANDVYVAGII